MLQGLGLLEGVDASNLDPLGPKSVLRETLETPKWVPKGSLGATAAPSWTLGGQERPRSMSGSTFGDQARPQEGHEAPVGTQGCPDRWPKDA